VPEVPDRAVPLPKGAGLPPKDHGGSRHLERRKPQDGKIRFKRFGPLDIELRVAPIPTVGGEEDVVMRILQAGEPILLANMGSMKGLQSPAQHHQQALRDCSVRRADGQRENHDPSLCSGSH